MGFVLPGTEPLPSLCLVITAQGRTSIDAEITHDAEIKRGQINFSRKRSHSEYESQYAFPKWTCKGK